MAMMGNVLYVKTSIQVTGMEDTWIMAIKFYRFEIEALAHAHIKGGRDLDPPPIDKELVVAMENKEIGFHHGPQFFWHQVVPDIGKHKP